ncbi:hypothetical protein ACIBG7_03565 [Nonomuraea sp. NPDC050328]|uniref:hypothetical protein n=1 Tax=Nonomuraea sp. NPDC050328 TaxID=3364361 RepID=UPI0037A05926
MGDRGFKPDQLERLAGMMGRLSTSADEAFKRASSLGVTPQMSALRELPGWAKKQDPDLRKRAALLRLQTGDPFAGLAWAGFSPLEISANGDKLDPTTLVYVNTVAAWAAENGRSDLSRRHGEGIDDYLKRLEAAAIAKVIPALEPHQQTVAKVLKVFGDVRNVATAAPIVTAQSAALLRLMANNKAWQPLINKLTGGRWTIQTRSATAPGTYLSTLTRKLFMKSQLYRDYVSLLPEYAEMDRVGQATNAGRALLGARVNNFINLTFGNNNLVKALEIGTHSGQTATLAGQANLFKVWAATADPKKLQAAAVILKTDPSKLTRMGVLAKSAGGLRLLGVAGGVASTLYSGANVISQGNPVDAFKRKGAGYVADVAELGFNASLTAAMIAPNPITIGATVVFGAVYVGAKVVEHWDDIKEGAGKAVEKTKNFIKSLNPFD